MRVKLPKRSYGLYCYFNPIRKLCIQADLSKILFLYFNYSVRVTAGVSNVGKSHGGLWMIRTVFNSIKVLHIENLFKI